MNLIVKNPQLAVWNGRQFRCAIGRNGIVAAADKREGDGKTPAGQWAVREVFYRADRVPSPVTVLPLRAIQPDDAWCDIEGDAKYNQHVKLPYPTHDELLWREDHLYDVVVVLGYNDAPVQPGRGSAIFLHIASSGYGASSGCVTLALPDLLLVLSEARADSGVEIFSP